MNIVIIPCYKVKNKILLVIKNIPKEINKIIIVDDLCPENTGDYVKKKIKSNRIIVIKNKKNLGVGGATIKGFKVSKKYKPKLIFKVDGDNQIKPIEINNFMKIISKDKKIECAKGDRFSKYKNFREMPISRFFGNKVLTCIGKVVTGYYNINDFTNGFFCLKSSCLNKINLDKISKDYFFENDMMIALSSINAKVVSIPTFCSYKGNQSNLVIYKIVIPFLYKFIIGFLNKKKFKKFM